MSGSNVMLTHALRYANLGWKIVPLHYPTFTEDGVKCSCGKKECKNQGKHPIPSKWTEVATDDKTQITEWWKVKPQANIGIACGPESGIFLVDIDGDKSVERMKVFATTRGADINSDLNTVKSKTSRGFHLVFKWDDRLAELKNWTKLSEDLDIKSTGGQFVAPPSAHKSGIQYEWITPPWGVDPKPLPDWLFDFLKTEQAKKKQEKLKKKVEDAKKRKYQVGKYVDVAIDDELHILRSVSEGERNTQLNESAIKLYGLSKGGYIDRSDVDSALAREARRLGLKEREIRATMDSAWNGAEAREIETYKEITSEELKQIQVASGPGFTNNLPREHFLTRLIAFGHDVSDAYAEYWYAAGIFALAVASDKKIRIKLRQGTVYPNVYVFIAGLSTLTHKSTAVKRVNGMLNKTRARLRDAEAPTEFSPEAFIEHMSKFNHTHWVRDEAAEQLAMMKKDYMRGFKGSVMQLYDCSPVHRMLRSRRGQENVFRVDDPFLNIMWATTDSALAANTDENDTLSGFMARFLYHFPRRPKDHWLPLEEGDPSLSIMEDVVSAQLEGIITQMEQIEPVDVHMSKDTATYFVQWQREREAKWIATNDEHAMQIYGRLAPTVLKLVMLYELGIPGFDPSRPMRLDFMKEACRMVDEYYMPTARSLYESVGSNADKNIIDRIVRVLRRNGGKATKRTISQQIKIKAKELQEYLETMEDAGMIEFREEREGGSKGRKALWVILTYDPSRLEIDSSITKVSIVGKVANVSNVETDDVCVCIQKERNDKSYDSTETGTGDGDGLSTLGEATVETFLSECERTETMLDEGEVAKQCGKTVVELRSVLDEREWTMMRGGKWKPPSRSC